MIRRFRFIIPFLAVIATFVLLLPGAEASCFFYSEEVGYVCDGRSAAEQPAFDAPEQPEDSFLDWVTYVYIDDEANIYAGPSVGSGVVRNVGDGFLYGTIQGSVEGEGQRWYILNPGEYIRADDVRLVQTPDFHGVEVTVQPERPFGWIVQEVRPSSEPDGEPNESFSKLERFTFFQVFDARVGEDDWIWYQIGGGRWIRQTYVSLADVSPRPDDVAENEFWVEVDLYEQTFAAYEGDRMVYAGLVSSGLNRWPTEEGIFQVWSRYTQAKMSGAEGKVDYYFIEDVPYIMYFDRQNEIALHGAYWHDRYGYKHSHGCVNMPPRDAEWVFNWSADGPNDLWVWVHTSDPMNYFD